MRRESSVIILLVVVCAGLGHWCSRHWGFNPAAFAELYGLDRQSTLIILWMSMITILVGSVVVSQDDLPTVILSDDLNPSPSERIRRPPDGDRCENTNHERRA